MSLARAIRLLPLPLALVLAPPFALAAWPPPPDAGSAAYADPSNWPSDPGFPEQWALFGYAPAAVAPALSAEERARGVGASVDRAWSRTRGDPRVQIALLGAGVGWNEPDLADRFALSRGELPPPRDASGQVAPGPDPWDRNADGRFSVRDYTQAAGREPPTPALSLDPRLTSRPDRGDVNGNGLLDPQDLIAVFSNGLDDDANGFADDICGWDFAWDDPDPFDDLAAGPGRGSGTLDALEAVAAADNAVGIAGACPECAALPLRVGTGRFTDPTRIAAALDYALAGGAAVAEVPAQAHGAGAVLQSSLDRAFGGGMAVIAAPADGLGLRHDLPSGLERTFLVRAVGFDGASWRASTTFLEANRCGSSGGHTAASAPSARCGAGAAALAAGVAGLVHSQALSSGLAPALSAGELMQLLSREAGNPGSPWSPTLGFGRLDARRAVDAVAEGRVPASVDIEAPRWFTTLPASAPFAVSAAIRSRAPFSVTLDAAGGLAPAEAAFVTFAQTGGTAELVGEVGTVDPARLTLPAPLPDEDPLSFAVTVRVRVVTHYGAPRGDVGAELRKTVYLHSQDLVDGYPRFVGGAGAGSPRLVDLDADGSDELVVATVDGEVHVIGPTGGELPGFPVRAGASASSPAFADLNGDGYLEVLVASLDGALFVFDCDGKPVPGFPVQLTGAATLPCFVQTPTGCSPSGVALDAGVDGGAFREVERGFLAAPVVATGLRGPVVMAAGLDGFIHGVWPDGTRAPGFPLDLSASPPGRARLVATPAAGDLDGDGWPELAAVATQVTAIGSTAWAYLFAGGLDGPVLASGWPVQLEGEGAGASPLIADFDDDGRPEVALQAVNGPLRLYAPSGEVVLELAGSSGAGPVTHPSAADLDGDGLLELIAADTAPDGAPRLLVWPAGEALSAFGGNLGPPLSPATGFPLRLPGPQELAGFAVADVDADGLPEILSGFGDFLGAVNGRGERAQGWPKLTGGTLASTPAVGLVSNRLTVAAATREGWVFAWPVAGFPSRILWDGFHHDPQNTGFTGTPLPRRSLTSIGEPDPELRPPGCCSGAPGPAELWAVAALLAWLSTRRAKADS